VKDGSECVIEIWWTRGWKCRTRVQPECDIFNFAMAPISTLVWPALVTGFKQPLQMNDFTTFDMLPFIPLHFFCTQFWQILHCNELLVTNTFTADPTWPSYSLVPHLLTFSTYHNLGFIHIDSYALTLHIIFPLIKPFNQLLFSLGKVPSGTGLPGLSRIKGR